MKMERKTQKDKEDRNEDEEKDLIKKAEENCKEIEGKRGSKRRLGWR